MRRSGCRSYGGTSVGERVGGLGNCTEEGLIEGDFAVVLAGEAAAAIARKKPGSGEKDSSSTFSMTSSNEKGSMLK